MKSIKGENAINHAQHGRISASGGWLGCVADGLGRWLKEGWVKLQSRSPRLLLRRWRLLIDTSLPKHKWVNGLKLAIKGYRPIQRTTRSLMDFFGYHDMAPNLE